MVAIGLDGRHRGKREEPHKKAPYSACCVYRISGGWHGTGRPNPSHETEFSGVNGDREEVICPDQILRRERGQRKYHFLCSANYEKDWQPYRVDLYRASECADHTNCGLSEFSTVHQCTHK